MTTRGRAWIVARDCRADDVVAGYRIPVWPDPEHLRPERFDPEALELRHEFAYYPFSKGPRGGIGK